MSDDVDYSRKHPEHGVRFLIRSGIVSLPLLGLGWALAPNNLGLTALMVGGAWYGLRKGKRMLAALDESEANKRRVRNFSFTEIPSPKDALGRDLLDKNVPYWEPKDVCYLKERSTEKIMRGDQVTEEPWFAYTVDPALVPRYREQEKYLRSTFPGRYQVIRYWWLTGFVMPALARRYPDWEFRLDEKWKDAAVSQPLEVSPATGSGRRLPDGWVARCRARNGSNPDWADAPDAWCSRAALDYQMFLFRGVRMALQPRLWSRRMSKRPSVRPLSILFNLLLDYSGGDKPKDQDLPQSVAILRPRRASMYVGDGFLWDVKHAQGWHRLSSEDIKPVVGDHEVDGDPRIYALAEGGVKPVFINHGTFNQHCWLGGMPGSGKTRFLENLIVQAIEAGMPLNIVDPKLDRDLLNRVWETARKCGREIDLHLFHLNAPRCPEVSDYNPLFEYDDPSELASRVAAVVERTKDPFWFRVGISTAKAVTTLTHYVMQYLRIIGSEFRDGRWQMAPRFADTPPMLMLALQWRMDNPGCSPVEARRGVEAFLRNRLNREWLPSTECEKHLIQMCRHPFFSPKGWNPSLKPVNIFGIANPETAVAWALRVIYFHLWVDFSDPAERRVDRPEFMETNQVVGSDDHSWWNMFKRCDTHPLARYQSSQSYLAPDYNRTADEFYREFIPTEALAAIASEDLDKWLNYHHDGLRMMCDKAKQDRKEYQKHMSTLQAALTTFEGEREVLVNSIDPEIILSDCVKNGGIVYIATNYMKDTEASEGICRTVVVDSLAHLGEVYGRSFAGRYPFYLICDEVATFITKDMVPIMSQGRGAGVHAFLAGQNNIDLEVAMGERARAAQVQGNLGAKISLRTASLDDAKIFSDLAGKCVIKVRNQYSLNTTKAYGNAGQQTIGDYSQSTNESFSDRDTERISPSLLVRLPTGQAMVSSRGAQYMVIQGQLPKPVTNILAEFSLLKYDRFAQKGELQAMEAEMAIADRWNREVASSNQALAGCLVGAGRMPSQPPPREIANRFAGERGADVVERSAGSDAGSGSASGSGMADDNRSHSQVGTSVGRTGYGPPITGTDVDPRSIRSPSAVAEEEDLHVVAVIPTEAPPSDDLVVDDHHHDGSLSTGPGDDDLMVS